MDLQAALHTFGLLNLPETLKALKSFYKSKASILHPDKGGSTKDMQLLNESYEFLVKIMSKREARITLRSKNLQNKEYLMLVAENVFSTFDIEATQERLKDIFGVKITLIKTVDNFSLSYAQRVLTFRSQDCETAMKFSMSIDCPEILKFENQLGSCFENIDLPVYGKLDLYHKGRDIKFTKSRYSQGRNSSLFFSVDELLPKDKILKAILKAKARPPKRMDGVAFFTLAAGFQSVGNDTFLLKNSGYTLQANRLTSWKCFFGTLYLDRSFDLSVPFFYEKDESFCEKVRALIVKFQDHPKEWQSISNELIAHFTDKAA